MRNAVRMTNPSDIPKPFASRGLLIKRFTSQNKRQKGNMLLQHHIFSSQGLKSCKLVLLCFQQVLAHFFGHVLL